MPMTADRKSGCTHAWAHSSEPAAPAHTTGRESPQAPRRHPTEPSTCPSYHLSRPRRTCPPTAVATRTRQGGCAGGTRARCPPQPTPAAGHVGRRRKPPERARQTPTDIVMSHWPVRRTRRSLPPPWARPPRRQGGSTAPGLSRPGQCSPPSSKAASVQRPVRLCEQVKAGAHRPVNGRSVLPDDGGLLRRDALAVAGGRRGVAEQRPRPSRRRGGRRRLCCGCGPARHPNNRVGSGGNGSYRSPTCRPHIFGWQYGVLGCASCHSFGRAGNSWGGPSQADRCLDQ